MKRFQIRHPEIFKKKQKPLAVERQHAQDPQTIQQHFYDFRNVVQKRGICSDDAWNMDETGFRIGCGRGHYILTFELKMPQVLPDPDKRDHITAAAIGHSLELAQKQLKEQAEHSIAKSARAKLKGTIAQRGGVITVGQVRGRHAVKGQDALEKLERKVAAEKGQIEEYSKSGGKGCRDGSKRAGKGS
jgi:hypothetical protein